MKAFYGFVIKEFRQIYRDKRTLTVLFGMPVIMMILFGFAIRNEVKNVEIAVLDFAKDESTGQLIHKINASGSFQIIKVLQTYDDIEEIFKEGDVKAVLVFEHQLKEKIVRGSAANVQLIVDATDPNLSGLIQAYLLNIIGSRVTIDNNIASAGIHTSIQMMYNPQLKSVNLFVPGLIAVILMLISALMTSISITREKEMGNMEILLVSPLKPQHIIIGKVLPYLVLSLINIVTILLLSYYLFGVPFQGSILLFLTEAILFILTALALGVFISSVANNQQTAMMISLAGLLLPTVLLSGFIFPIQSMPIPLQLISHLIPAKWFLLIVRGIMLKGSGIEFLWQETLILASMAALFIVLSFKKFNVRLQ